MSIVRHTRNLSMPGSEDLLNTFGMAPLRQTLKNIGPPAVEATSLAFDLEGLVHRQHVLGVHRFGCYGDGVHAGLLIVHEQVVYPVCDWFHHDDDREGHNLHVHSLRHHLDAHNLGPGIHVQNFGHYFQLHDLGILHRSLVVLKQRRGFQWLDIHDSSQARRVGGPQLWHHAQKPSVSEMRP